MPFWAGGKGGGEASFLEDVPLVEFTYLVFTRLPGDSSRRRFKFLLLYPLLYVYRLLSGINSPFSLLIWCNHRLGL